MRGVIVRPIPSFPGYQATDDGRVIGKRGFSLSPAECRGYLQVTVHVDGVQAVRRVHRLVCEAFHGPAPSSGHHAAHCNGRRHDNRAENLRWATPAENSADMVLHGTRLSGERHGRAQLTQDQVDEIRSIYRTERGRCRIRYGLRQQLAARFGVGVHVIKDIAAGRCWLEPAAP